MQRVFVFILVTALSLLVGANDVMIGHQAVPPQLLNQLVCSSEDELKQMIRSGEIQVYDEAGLMESRSLVIENLLNEVWMPLNSLELDDYCALTHVLSRRKTACGKISIERLRKLSNDFCRVPFF